MPRSIASIALVALVVAPLTGFVAGCTAEMKARAYAGADRDEWQQPERVIESLGIEPGQRIADLGSGGGYFTFRLADATGSDGRVYAVDVDEAMNERLEGLIAERGAGNVVVVHATPDDPSLPEPVDLLFTSNTYHHIDDRVAYFERVAESLRPGGRIAVLEFKKEGWFQRVFPHSTDADLIRDEMESAGYTMVASHDFAERQHFLIFERAGTARPAAARPEAVTATEAVAETTGITVTCTEPRRPMCTREYRPVCALRDTGIRCVTEPCPTVEWKTYTNGCTACANPDVIGHRPNACDG
jgi:arsenite methyltransferase